MATIVQDFGQSEIKTTFSDTPEEDIQHAKTFWQSVQLLPPMESRLVSSHMKQRLKVAPQAHQQKNITYTGIDEPPQLKEFLAKAEEMQSADRSAKISNLMRKKERHMNLFIQQRKKREEVESISKGKGIKRFDPMPLPIDQENENEHAEDIRKETFADISTFEENILAQGDFKSDSDSD